MSDTQKLIRSELNIEKFMFWVTANSNKQSHRVERTLTDADGNKRTVAVTVGLLNGKEIGVLRTFDLKVFYVLLRHWQELDKPSDGPVPFVIHDLAHRLNLSWSGRTSAMLKASLERLRFIPLKWENSYFSKDSDVTETVLNGFTILSHLTLHERTKGQGAPTTKCAFQFDDRIVKNIQQNYSKPLRLNEMLTLTSELALMLYTRLDLWMSKTTSLEKTLTNLVVELGLDPKTYPYPSQRKRLFAPPVSELQGRALSTGVVARAEIVPTAAGDDFKLVVRKVAREYEVVAAEGPVSEGTLEQKLSSRGVSIGVARKLVRAFAEERIEKQITHFDWLSERSKIKNGGGWLKLAIESDYVLPEEVVARKVAAGKSAEHADAVVESVAATTKEVADQTSARQERGVNAALWARVLKQLPVVGMSNVAQGMVAQLVLLDDTDATLTLEAPGRFERDFIRENHLEKLKAAIQASHGGETDFEVNLVLPSGDQAWA